MTDDEVMNRRGWRRILRVLLLANVVGTVVAYVVMLEEVETVIVSGPLLFLAGAITLFIARTLKYALGIAVGGAQIGICLLFVSLVNILRWGPSAAEGPFKLMSILYMAGALPAAVAAALRIPDDPMFGRCEQCGYRLYGLTAARCPECGRGFDPALLPALARGPETVDEADP